MNHHCRPVPIAALKEIDLCWREKDALPFLGHDLEQDLGHDLLMPQFAAAQIS
jgi:hypothetical protein